MMKHIKRIMSAFLFSGMLLAGAMPAAAAQEDVITAEVESAQNKVELTLKVAENSTLSSGVVVVYYDNTLLTFDSQKTGGLWDVEDINVFTSEDGKTGVSYAWASEKQIAAAGDMVSLDFTVKDGAEGKTAAFEIVSRELYSGEESKSQAALEEKTEIPATTENSSAASESTEATSETTETTETTSESTEATSESTESTETTSDSNKTTSSKGKDKNTNKPSSSGDSSDSTNSGTSGGSTTSSDSITSGDSSASENSGSQTIQEFASVDTGDNNPVAPLVLLLGTGGVLAAYAYRRKF